MAAVNQMRSLRDLLYPSCPYNNSVILLALRLGVIFLGTIGLSFFNIWVSGVYFLYSVIYNILIWPIIHCQHCYYKVKEQAVDNGNIVMNLLPLDEWKEFHLEKHIACGKKWGAPNLMILWLVPIILMGISLILDFSGTVLIILVSLIAVLSALGIYTRWRVCTTCAFMEECHAAF